MFFNNMFSNMQQPQQSVPVMGAQGSPFAMQQQIPAQQMPQQQQMITMFSPSNGSIFNIPASSFTPAQSRWGER